MAEYSDLTKSYYKIKDVAELTGVPQSTLRFWETQFPEIQPHRSSHNQRYYSPETIETIRIVHFLVKEKGYKIEAAREQLKKNRKNISKRLKIVAKLTEVRASLQELLSSLEVRSLSSPTD